MRVLSILLLAGAVLLVAEPTLAKHDHGEGGYEGEGEGEGEGEHCPPPPCPKGQLKSYTACVCLTSGAPPSPGGSCPPPCGPGQFRAAYGCVCLSDGLLLDNRPSCPHVRCPKFNSGYSSRKRSLLTYPPCKYNCPVGTVEAYGNCICPSTGQPVCPGQPCQKACTADQVQASFGCLCKSDGELLLDRPKCPPMPKCPLYTV